MRVGVNIFSNKLSSVHLITFGGGNFEFRRSAHRLACQAKSSGLFSTVTSITDKNLASYIPDHWKTHSDFIKNSNRGFGFWIWKPLIIKKRLSEIPPGDALLYLDAGFELNLQNKGAISRFQDYVIYVKQHGSLAMQMQNIPSRNIYPLEKNYSKKALVDWLNPTSATLESNQLLGGVIFMESSHSNLEFIQQWCDLLVINNYILVNDDLDSGESAEFVAHRHDQSVFSIIYKEKSRFKIADETDWRPDWNSDGQNYPIWCLRNRTGISKGSMRTSDWIDKLMLTRKSRGISFFRTRLKGWMS